MHSSHVDALKAKHAGLEARLHTVERIISADHPDFRPAVRSDEDLAQLENISRRN